VNFSLIFFVVLSGIALGGGFLSVTLKNLMHSGLSLLLTLAAVAGLFALMDADFLFAVQIMLYAGGVMVLVLFAVMLVEGISDKTVEATNEQRGWGLLAAVIFFCITIGTVVSGSLYTLDVLGQDDRFGGVGEATSGVIGRELMTTHLLPFEIASVMLLAALVGAILLTRGGPEETSSTAEGAEDAEKS